jgi:tetratricopeptide (TPR) repeat protein
VELSATGDRRAAATAYRTALGLRPGFYAAAINLGLALEALDQREDALRTWEDALQPVAERT